MDIYIQIYNLFAFFIIGIIIGTLFDIFRVIRKTFKTSDIITYVEDIVFWLLVGYILLFSIFFLHGGEIRSYIFIGLIIGLTIYMLLISKYFIKISVIILNFFKKIIYKPIKSFFYLINKIFFRPIKLGINKIINYIKILSKKTSKNVKNHENINNYDKMH